MARQVTFLQFLPVLGKRRAQPGAIDMKHTACLAVKARSSISGGQIN
eukprot:CAMPEP_0113308298 /NCGR_PEP_ID=MMETSP0010_2-20120614/6791_1 /TAXON_ID=216773 ORGANISM="Corethron hystrix, Strain 308" /NCGR_SAMPLE_ID=MMETSP0010_2 /ASSEMBLY_ACC=CAM_ASM_000155 /LENGTH=46 /DNA_ID=CAMNT_0000163309 /DNA_START=229 /DNA_END=369 /DNA_ORIENTATION=+ /assembly_acc=CAM_ASM_000155